MFRGNHTASFDQKGRIRIPTAFLSHLHESFSEELFATSLDGKSARIYPMAIWQQLEERIQGLSAVHPSRIKLMARFTYYGQSCKLDKTGRVLLPALLRQKAELEGEVAVLGHIDYLEIWNRERYESQLLANPLTEEDLLALAEMGI